MSSTERLLDAAGHQRSPVTMPGYHRGRPPKNKGRRFPADPPTVEEIVAVMRATGDRADGARLRALIVVLWRAGLRISEALDLAETDLDRARGALTVRRGKGGRRREVGMDRWAWDQLTPYLEVRATLPVGALFCVIHGPTPGRLRRPPLRAHRVATASAKPNATRSTAGSLTGQPYHPHIQHCNLGVTSIYLQGIDSAEIIETVHSRPAPVISATSGLHPAR
jgi:integrase